MWGWAFALGLITLAVLAVLAIAEIAILAAQDVEADVDFEEED
jgi:hypothetical protein